MTIIEAINRIDDLKPNGFTQNDKVRWLSTCDGMISRDVLETHEDGPEEPFAGYGPDTPVDTELLVPYPYDQLYIFWLECQIDYYNAEYTKYNNSVLRFHDDFTTFQNWYNRNHKPKTARINYY